MLLDRSGQRECKPATVHASRVNRWPPNVDPRVRDHGEGSSGCVRDHGQALTLVRAVGVRTQVR
jgi:hypothetical protein